MKPIVSIIMGSDSDWPKMKGAEDVLKELKISCEVKVVSAHRTPSLLQNFSRQAKKRGIKVIIAGAGGAAHLPGMVASATELPVIGVPIELKSLKGLDSVLSIVQMPKGVPVACVGVDNSDNAGLLAARILALTDKSIDRRLKSYRKGLSEKVKKMNRGLLRKRFDLD